MMAVNLSACARNYKSVLKSIPSCLSAYARRCNRHSSTDTKVYELRIYNVHPKDFRSMMDLTAEKINIRTSHSKMTGFWTSEIGGLNDLFHIWEYDNLKHRAEVRLSLAKNEEWQKTYISKILPWMSRQENLLLQQITSNNLTQPDLKGIYEIEQLSLYGSESTWKDKVLQYCDQNRGDAILIGGFKGLIGNLNTAYVLWHHKSQEDALKSKLESENNTEFVNSRDMLYEDLQWGHSRILLPTSWSSLQ